MAGSNKLTRNMLFLGALALLWLVSCKREDVGVTGALEWNQLAEGGLSLTPNPHGNAPLVALVTFQTREPCTVDISVEGAIPISHAFSEVADQFEIPILGLYPDANNQVKLTIHNEQGAYADTTLTISTDPLSERFPEIRTEIFSPGLMEPGLTFSELMISNFGDFQTFPVMYDQTGTVRWFLDLSVTLDRYSTPIQRLKNGNLYFTNNGHIREFTMMGEQVNKWGVGSGYRAHHDLIELPNGNFVFAVQKYGTTIERDGTKVSSTEDFIIEQDRNTGEILTEWDLREYLDVDRTDVVDGQGDWFHMNAIWYDETDETLIVSGRNQGLIKVNWDNELIWILAPHQGWGKAGRDGSGPETAPYLLTAVDASGAPYSQGIQDGTEASSAFDWSWGQHAPMRLPNGNIFVFDNGFNRHYGASGLYSRGVEYRVDEESMTVEQIWEYGTDRGAELYSNIISDVDYLPQTDNRLIMPGNLRFNGEAQAKVVEVAYPSGERVFEASLIFSDVNVDGPSGWGQMDLVYRSGRMSLYPDLE